MPKTSSAFAFSGSATSDFSSGFGARTTEANPTTFGAPTTTAPPSFFGTTSTPSAPSFGSTGAFTSPTPSLFGASSSSAPTTTAATSPSFGTAVTPAFSSGASALSAPVFGSSASFGASQPAFGSNQSAFGVNPPSFTSVAPTTLTQKAAAQPTPCFGSTSTSSFGSGGFGSTGTTPSFGSPAGFGSAQTTPPAFGSTPSATQAFGSTSSAAPAFGSTPSATPAFGSASAATTFGSNVTASTSTTQASTPFSFSAISSPPSVGTGGFSFGSSAATPKPMFQFGSSSSSTNATATPTPVAPFSFQGAPAAAPGTCKGFIVSNFRGHDVQHRQRKFCSSESLCTEGKEEITGRQGTPGTTSVIRRKANAWNGGLLYFFLTMLPRNSNPQVNFLMWRYLRDGFLHHVMSSPGRRGERSVTSVKTDGAAVFEPEDGSFGSLPAFYCTYTSYYDVNNVELPYPEEELKKNNVPMSLTFRFCRAPPPPATAPNLHSKPNTMRLKGAQLQKLRTCAGAPGRPFRKRKRKTATVPMTPYVTTLNFHDISNVHVQ
ncbi:unnamed protein product, partial [Nesidiocoris tenuis]